MMIFRRWFSLMLLAALILGAAKFEDIRDWWWLRNYQPVAEIQALADKAALNDTGRRMFYVGRPRIDDKLNFARSCPVGEAEGSLVLGCYSSGYIYLLEVKRTELAGVMEVTAAHEMLHAAYERLSSKDQQTINRQLEQFYGQVNNPELDQVLVDYEQTEPGQRLNELHSLLPTQIAVLSPELEAYYSRYFTNQDQVANAYLAYQAVFRSLEAQIEQLRADASSLQAQISAQEAAMEQTRTEIETMSSQMDSLKAAGRIDEYNALVPAYNGLVREYNGMITYYRDLIALHNSKVDQLNQLALEQNELVESLDSTKFTPL